MESIAQRILPGNLDQEACLPTERAYHDYSVFDGAKVVFKGRANRVHSCIDGAWAVLRRDETEMLPEEPSSQRCGKFRGSVYMNVFS